MELYFLFSYGVLHPILERGSRTAEAEDQRTVFESIVSRIGVYEWGVYTPSQTYDKVTEGLQYFQKARFGAVVNSEDSTRGLQTPFNHITALPISAEFLSFQGSTIVIVPESEVHQREREFRNVHNALVSARVVIASSNEVVECVRLAELVNHLSKRM